MNDTAGTRQVTFYRVHLTAEYGTSVGFEWHTARRAADKSLRAHRNAEKGQDGTVEAVAVTPTKAGIRAALGAWASHPDNG